MGSMSRFRSKSRREIRVTVEAPCAAAGIARRASSSACVVWINFTSSTCARSSCLYARTIRKRAVHEPATTMHKHATIRWGTGSSQLGRYGAIDWISAIPKTVPAIVRLVLTAIPAHPLGISVCSLSVRLTLPSSCQRSAWPVQAHPLRHALPCDLGRPARLTTAHRPPFCAA